MRTLNFRLTINGIADETLVVRQFQGHESISDSVDATGQPVFGYRYQIDLASRNSRLAAKDIVDNTAVLEIIRNGKLVQQVHGMIRSFTKGDTGHHHTFYAITLVPSLERLSLRHNSRIFQHKNVQQILTLLLEDMGITAFCFSLKRPPAEREFCVQYRESDLAFFHRLAAEEGLMYTFSHDAGKHTLVISDNTQGFPLLEGQIPYNALSGGAFPDGYISRLTRRTQTQVSSIQLQDYSFKKPATTLPKKPMAPAWIISRPSMNTLTSRGALKMTAMAKP
ncbi:type VI secretion system tip protein TssI/VgrG [Vibrio sp. PP-XX7]